MWSAQKITGNVTNQFTRVGTAQIIYLHDTRSLSSDDDLPEHNHDDNCTPQNGRLVDHSEAEKKQIKHILACLESEQKRSELLRELLDKEKGNVKQMKTSIPENKACHGAKLERLKVGKAEGQEWKPKLMNCLQNVLGTSGVPLHHITCKDLPPNHQLANPAKALVHECPWNGLVCAEDNGEVHGLIKQAVANTQSWDWIKSLNQAQDRRGAMTVLGTHF